MVNTLLFIVLFTPKNELVEMVVDLKFGMVAVIVVRFDVLIKPVAKIFVVVILVTLIVPLDKLVETKFVIVLVGV